MPTTMYSDDYESQYINTLAVAYSGSNITLGGEYNLRENTSNVVDNTSSAFSVYGNLDIGNDVSILEDMTCLILKMLMKISGTLKMKVSLLYGIEKQMTKGVKLALNLQSFKQATLEGRGGSRICKYSLSKFRI